MVLKKMLKTTFNFCVREMMNENTLIIIIKK